MSDECRPVDIEIDGQPETIRVHGCAEPSKEAAAALGVLVGAVRDRLATEPVSVRRLALTVMREHWPTDGRCRCGRSALNATLWSVHMLNALAQAGVTLPLDQPAEERP